MAKPDKRIIFYFLVIFFSFILPVAILVTTVLVFRRMMPVREEIPEKELEIAGRIVPSQILRDKSKYSKKRMTVRGRVFLEPVVCERKECSVDDPCCGCPYERALVISDPKAVLTSKSGGRLRLISKEGKQLCRRRKLSCKYECQDWVEGAVYDVSGVFFAEPPPPGWMLSLQYYYEVEDKRLIKKGGLGESIGYVLDEIRGMVERIKTSGYYILP